MKAIFTYVPYYMDMWINMYDKGFQKVKAFKRILATRLRTTEFGHFMVLKGANDLSSIKLKPVMRRNCKISNFLNEKFNFQKS
jgi:hypothetical protein